MSEFKPMLAAAVKEISGLPYPMIASPKIDGIRCVIHQRKAVTRKLKAIPNRFIRETLENAGLPEGLDGELTTGDNFQECTSGIMSFDGEPDFTYWVFDRVSEEPYFKRLGDLQNLENRLPWLQVLPAQIVADERDLREFEVDCLTLGLEGVCLRTPDSPYKFGRSTLKQGWLLKLKRFVDSEAVITRFEEQYHNTNALEKDELGYAKRSKTLEGREGKNTLGKFLVRDTHTGVEFSVGTGEGLTDALRETIWRHQSAYLGKILKYKFQPHGMKDAPRLPIFLGFRDERDLG